MEKDASFLLLVLAAAIGLFLIYYLIRLKFASRQYLSAVEYDPSDTVLMPKTKAIKIAPPLFTLYVLPEPDMKFVGYDLLQTLLSVNLTYGKMSIFHRYKKVREENKVLFSVAQATEPGIFNMDTIGSCECTGLILFMQLTGPEHDHEALEIFIDTAEQLADNLNGRLLDHKHMPLTTETKLQMVHDIYEHLKSVSH